MKTPPLEVLYEDNHLLAVLKPAGLPTMGVAADKPSVLTEAKRYIKRRYNKPGNVYLGVVSRLDAPVSGVVLLARTSKAARRLNEQFRNRTVEKTYWAIVEGMVQGSSVECVDWLGPDERHRRMHIVGPNQPDAKQSLLTYRRLARLPEGALVEVLPTTGRKHQIRLQLASRGHPIFGDRKYGSSRKFPVGIALHSRQLVVVHPTLGEPVRLQSPVPPEWEAFGVRD